jgi:hypothetical protein
MAILIIYMLPPAANAFASNYIADSTLSTLIHRATIISPFAAAHEVPLYFDESSSFIQGRWIANPSGERVILGYNIVDVYHFFGFVIYSLVFNSVLIFAMARLFNSRWRVSTSTR